MIYSPYSAFTDSSVLYYRLQGRLGGYQIQKKRSFQKQVMLDLALFLGQMASASALVVLKLFDW